MRNKSASLKIKNKRLHCFLAENEPPRILVLEHFHWLIGIVMTFVFHQHVIPAINEKFEIDRDHNAAKICKQTIFLLGLAEVF